MAPKSLFASYEVMYRIIQCNKLHTTGENLILSAPTDNVKQYMFWDVFFVILWLMQFC